MAFQGFIAQGSTIAVPFLTDSSSVPTNADAAPRFHVYDQEGDQLASMSGQCSQAHTGSITGVTQANPASVTSTSHGLETGARITVTGVGGTTSANTTATITKVDANTFTMDGVDTSGDSAYTSGGTWNISGYYEASIAATSGNGFNKSQTYFVYAHYDISSSARAQIASFTVV